jgi:hypothetical protein
MWGMLKWGHATAQLKIPNKVDDPGCLTCRKALTCVEVPLSPFASEGERGTAITHPTSEAASVAQRQQRP